MGELSKIQWTDATFNPWIGCTKVSPGCAHCYAEVSTRARVLRSQGIETWGKGAQRSRTKTWNQPLLWNRFKVCERCGEQNVIENEACGRPDPHTGFCDGELRKQRVFCASLSDWLDDEVPINWLLDLLKLIQMTPHLDWQMLTKRPENWQPRMIEAHKSLSHDAVNLPLGSFIVDWCAGKAPANVWIGTTVENQEYADKRIPELLKIPARVRFLSCEPLLGPVDISRYLSFIERSACGLEDDPLAACLLQQGVDEGHADARRMIEWVIIGGESGPKARPCNIEWIRSLVQQCKAAGVAPFVKQLGAEPFEHREQSLNINKSGLKLTMQSMTMDTTFCLKDKKGGDITEWPDDLKVREFPV